MNILAKLLPAKTAITSDSIRAEIEHSTAEISAHRAKLASVMDGIATMSDSEHVAAEASIAATKRAIARLEAKIANLDDELPKVIAAEDAAAKVAAVEALRQRAEACRKANTVTAKKLLAEYDRLASQMGDVFTQLSAINTEHESVRAALKDAGLGGEDLPHWSSVHRKHPDRQASERREVRPYWVYESGDGHEASLDENGDPKLALPSIDRLTGRRSVPRLEHREIVVGRTSFRPGHHENPLLTISLPPAFAGGKAAWPRRS